MHFVKMSEIKISFRAFGFASRIGQDDYLFIIYKHRMEVSGQVARYFHLDDERPWTKLATLPPFLTKSASGRLRGKPAGRSN